MTWFCFRMTGDSKKKKKKKTQRVGDRFVWRELPYTTGWWCWISDECLISKQTFSSYLSTCYGMDFFRMWWLGSKCKYQESVVWKHEKNAVFFLKCRLVNHVNLMSTTVHCVEESQAYPIHREGKVDSIYW